MSEIIIKTIHSRNFGQKEFEKSCMSVNLAILSNIILLQFFC